MLPYQNSACLFHIHIYIYIYVCVCVCVCMCVCECKCECDCERVRKMILPKQCLVTGTRKHSSLYCVISSALRPQNSLSNLFLNNNNLRIYRKRKEYYDYRLFSVSSCRIGPTDQSYPHTDKTSLNIRMLRCTVSTVLAILDTHEVSEVASTPTFKCLVAVILIDLYYGYFIGQ
jgi:hypothetical protein